MKIKSTGLTNLYRRKSIINDYNFNEIEFQLVDSPNSISQSYINHKMHQESDWIVKTATNHKMLIVKSHSIQQISNGLSQDDIDISKAELNVNNCANSKSSFQHEKKAEKWDGSLNLALKVNDSKYNPNKKIISPKGSFETNKIRDLRIGQFCNEINVVFRNESEKEYLDEDHHKSENTVQNSNDRITKKEVVESKLLSDKSLIKNQRS